MAIAKLTRTEASALWDLITNAQRMAWLEGRKFGDEGGEANRCPYPVTGTKQDIMNLYRLLRGEENGTARTKAPSKAKG